MDTSIHFYFNMFHLLIELMIIVKFFVTVLIISISNLTILIIIFVNQFFID